MSQQNRYPTLMDQLNQHIEDRPDLYRLKYDPIEHHMDSRAIHVYDTTRHANIVPERTQHDYQKQHLDRIAARMKREREQAEKHRLQVLANEPILFKLCRRVSKTLTDIYNG